MDITDILKEWEYNPADNTRKIMGEDGLEKLQVRLPLGIEQYEVNGRPDGMRPFGKESYLDYYEEMAAQYIEKNNTDEGFGLESEDCMRLAEEGIFYYYRYVLFFQIQDYVNTIRDTERNSRLFDFVKKYAVSDADKEAMEQYQPYIIRMGSAAKALWNVKLEQFDEALRRVCEGIREIEMLGEVSNSVFVYEKKRSLSILREMEKEIRKQKPLSKLEKLQKQMARAVKRENYEKAAELRDVIRVLKSARKSSS